MGKAKPDRGSERICILATARETWTAPPTGEACENRRHSHMTRAKVEELVRQGRMELVQGTEVRRVMGKEVERTVDLPVARLKQGARWRKKISDPKGPAPMAVMQLI
jgi:hypothetical protein